MRARNALDKAELENLADFDTPSSLPENIRGRKLDALLSTLEREEREWKAAAQGS